MALTVLDATLDSLAGYRRGFWPGSDVAGAAVDARTRLAAAIDAWHLSDVAPLRGGYVSLVCTATRASRSVVVKLIPRIAGGEALANEGRALDFWQPTGAVVDLRGRRDDNLTLLMDRLRPGSTLEAADLPTETMLAALGDLARRLHVAGPPPAGFETLRDSNSAHQWRDALAVHPALLDELDALLAPSGEDRLIHGDLHARNALRHGDAWLAIDPHAPVADRHAEISPLREASLTLPNHQQDAVALAQGWVAVYARHAGMNPDRVRIWTRVRARAGGIETAQRNDHSRGDHRWAAALHLLADALT